MSKQEDHIAEMFDGVSETINNLGRLLTTFGPDGNNVISPRMASTTCIGLYQNLSLLKKLTTEQLSKLKAECIPPPSVPAKAAIEQAVGATAEVSRLKAALHRAKELIELVRKEEKLKNRRSLWQLERVLDERLEAHSKQAKQASEG